MKRFIAILATAIGLCVCGTAAAQQDLRGPDQVSPAPVATQDLRGPDQVSPIGAEPGPAAVAPADAVSIDGGLSTLWIVLIAAGGALALSGIAYTAMRVVRRHHEHVVT